MIFSLLFYLFAAVLVAAAVGVILARNPVHAVLLLILAFFQSAVLWLMVEAEFLAIVLVLVYVGAVMVLFLFVVMMLDVTVAAVRGGLVRYAPLGLLIAALMVVELAHVIWVRSNAAVSGGGAFVPLPPDQSNTKELGAILYTDHVYAFEIAAVILLLAIVSAITLTMRKRPGLKQQDISYQVSVRPEDRIRIVQMKVEERR